ncbi:MAG: DoxX family protein [Thermoanaerobaculia bacterium]
MHRFAWVVQVVLGVYFVAIGVMHFIVPEALPDQMSWMHELSTWLHVASGTAEILGGLGLVLPAATRIRPQLTPLAAVGLAIVMLLAALWHVPRGEVPNVVLTLVLAVVLIWLARVRSRTHPIPPRRHADVR